MINCARKRKNDRALLFVLCFFLLFIRLEAIATPRNIYLDLGAFHGDTLQMFTLHGIPERCHPGVDWEVFAFEASPLLSHVTQLQADYLNGASVSMPVSYKEIPGMQEYVDRAYRENLLFDAHLKNFFETYERLLTSRQSSRGSYQEQFGWTAEQREAQLREAKKPSPFPGTRYTAYAMGVGHQDTTLQMDWAYSNYMNGGGNVVGIDYGAPRHRFTVPILRLSRWIKDSFSKDDYIYIKMDIEGMEFLLLQDLIKTGCLQYIKEMDIEWHGRFNVPDRHKEKELRKAIVEAGILLRDHH